MSDRLPWPLGLRREEGCVHTGEEPDLTVQMMASQRDTWWMVQEFDRAAVQPPDDYARDVRAIRWFAAETVDRFGYEAAQRFIDAVLRQDALDAEHASLMANVEARFGYIGLLLFTAYLACNCTGRDRYEGRAA